MLWLCNLCIGWTYLNLDGGRSGTYPALLGIVFFTPDILAPHIQIQQRLLWVLYARQYWCHWSESLSIVLYMNDKRMTYSLHFCLDSLALKGQRPKAQFSRLMASAYCQLAWNDTCCLYTFLYLENRCIVRFSLTQCVRGTQKIREIIIPKENVSPTEDTVYKVICEATMLWLNKTYKKFCKKEEDVINAPIIIFPESASFLPINFHQEKVVHHSPLWST